MVIDIDVRLLRAFAAVIKTGSITGTATKLNRSQPAISLQIKKLEELLGARLLNRTDGSLSMTPAGGMLLPYAERLVELNDRMCAQMCSAVVIERLRLGLSEGFAESYLSPVLKDFAGSFPAVDVDITVSPASQLLVPFQEGLIDMVVAEELATSHTAVARHPLAWLASADFRLAPQRAVPLVLMRDDCLYRRAALAELSSTNLPWEVACTATNWPGVRAAVLAGLGVTAAPRFLAGRQGLRVLDVDPSSALPTLPAIALSLKRTPQSRTVSGDHLASLMLAAMSRPAATRA